MTEPNRHFSHSQLSSAFGDAGCLRLWAYRYVEKMTSPTNGALHVGSSWDYLTRVVIGEKINGNIVNEERAENIITHTFNNPIEETNAGAPIEYDFSDIDQDQTLDRLVSAAKLYITDVLPTIDPVSVQREVRTTVLPGVDILGYVDLVERAGDGSLVVTDNKASLSGKASRTPAKAMTDQQLALYQAMIAKEDGNTPMSRGWRILDIGYKKTVAKFSTILVREQSVATANKLNDLTMQSVTQQAGALLAIEKTGLFPPTGRGTWKCSEKWCGYFDICEYGRKSRTSIAVGVEDEEWR